MKKIFVFSILAGILFTNYSISSAIQPKAEDYQIDVSSESESESTKQDKNVSNTENIVFENSLIKIVEKSNKYGIFDKTTNQYIIKPVLDDIKKLTDANDIEYKFKSKDMIGYMNLDTKDTFLSYFDDITILNDKYLKIKKENRFGVVDKKGRVIVPTQYEKVSAVDENGTEYLVGKLNGKYTTYRNDGTKIEESELYQIEEDEHNNKTNSNTYVSSLMNDLNPILKDYILAMRKYNQENDYISDNSTNEPSIEEKDEINKSENEVEAGSEDNTSIVSNDFEKEEDNTQVSDDYSNTENITKLSVTREDYAKTISEDDKEIPINDRAYYLTNSNGKFGLKTSHDREVIPAKYDKLKVKTLNSRDIIVAISKNDTKLYESNGEVIAKRFHNKINVYTSMRKYEYVKEDNIYNISFNNKKIGEIELFDDGTYEYKRVGFNLSNMKKANELFATLVTSEI